MFWFIEPSSGQIQNIVLVQSVSAHIMGFHTVYRITLTLKVMFYSVLFHNLILKFNVIL